jgi:hypothetical protein
MPPKKKVPLNLIISDNVQKDLENNNLVIEKYDPKVHIYIEKEGTYKTISKEKVKKVPICEPDLEKNFKLQEESPSLTIENLNGFYEYKNQSGYAIWVVCEKDEDKKIIIDDKPYKPILSITITENLGEKKGFEFNWWCGLYARILIYLSMISLKIRYQSKKKPFDITVGILGGEENVKSWKLAEYFGFKRTLKSEKLDKPEDQTKYLEMSVIDIKNLDKKYDEISKLIEPRRKLQIKLDQVTQEDNIPQVHLATIDKVVTEIEKESKSPDISNKVVNELINSPKSIEKIIEIDETTQSKQIENVPLPQISERVNNSIIEENISESEESNESENLPKIVPIEKSKSKSPEKEKKKKSKKKLESESEEEINEGKQEKEVESPKRGRKKNIEKKGTGKNPRKLYELKELAEDEKMQMKVEIYNQDFHVLLHDDETYRTKDGKSLINGKDFLGKGESEKLNLYGINNFKTLVCILSSKKYLVNDDEGSKKPIVGILAYVITETPLTIVWNGFNNEIRLRLLADFIKINKKEQTLLLLISQGESSKINESNAKEFGFEKSKYPIKELEDVFQTKQAVYGVNLKGEFKNVNANKIKEYEDKELPKMPKTLKEIDLGEEIFSIAEILKEEKIDLGKGLKKIPLCLKGNLFKVKAVGNGVYSFTCGKKNPKYTNEEAKEIYNASKAIESTAKEYLPEGIENEKKMLKIPYCSTGELGVRRTNKGIVKFTCDGKDITIEK